MRLMRLALIQARSLTGVPHERVALLGLIGCCACAGVRLRPTSKASAGQCGAITTLWEMPDALIVTRSATDRTWQVETTQARINLIALDAEAYCVTFGEYPATYDQAFTDISKLSPELSGCGLGDVVLQDAWDRPIYYGLQDGRPMIVSAGADGRFSTDDDISLPDPRARFAEPLLDLLQECRPPVPFWQRPDSGRTVKHPAWAGTYEHDGAFLSLDETRFTVSDSTTWSISGDVLPGTGWITLSVTELRRVTDSEVPQWFQDFTDLYDRHGGRLRLEGDTALVAGNGPRWIRVKSSRE